MLGVKNVKLVFFLIMFCFIMMGCTDKEANPTLEKVKGDGLTYSEYFKSFDKLNTRENITYYQPLSIDEMLNVAPDSIKKALPSIDSKKLPFEVNEQTAYLVTSKDKKGNVQNQVQFTNAHNNEYNQTEAFYILTLTELDENPLDLYDFSRQQTEYAGNELRKEVLTDDVPIFHQVITTDGALAYRHYSFDKMEKCVGTVVTAANELYGYSNGYLYHVGYFLENKNSKEVQDKILQLTRSYILEEESLNE